MNHFKKYRLPQITLPETSAPEIKKLLYPKNHGVFCDSTKFDEEENSGIWRNTKRRPYLIQKRRNRQFLTDSKPSPFWVVLVSTALFAILIFLISSKQHRKVQQSK